MKKVAFSTLALIVFTLVGYIIWLKLQLTFNKSKEIKIGEKIIENIEKYRKVNRLPNDNDWMTLRKLGFKDNIDFLHPQYRKLDDNNFELIFIEGFDGPYLMWTSNERQWKEGYPIFDKTTERK